jgi:hypothetical protein
MNKYYIKGNLKSFGMHDATIDADSIEDAVDIYTAPLIAKYGKDCFVYVRPMLLSRHLKNLDYLGTQDKPYSTDDVN